MENNNYIKRIAHIGKKLVIILIASNVCFNILGNTLNVKASTGDYYEKFNYNDQIIVSDDIEDFEKILTYEDIVNLVNSNQYLSPDEKKFILSNKEYFDDNLKYMDTYHVEEMLTNLQIQYFPVTPEDKTDVGGSYNNYKHTINIYIGSRFENADKGTLTHELSHAFSVPQNTYSNLSYGSYVIEALNMMINNEYFGDNVDYDIGYLMLKPYAKLLGEIVDSETLKKAFFKSNIAMLEHYLIMIIPDETIIKDLFITIDANFSIQKQISKNPEKQEDLKALYNSNNEIILNYFKLLYEAKTNSLIEENEEFMYWYNKGNFFENKFEYLITQNAKDMILNYSTTIKEKKYFRPCNDNNCTTIKVCTKLKPKNILPSKIDIQVYLEEGIIQKVNGTYIINQDYKDTLFMENGQLYQKVHEPIEFDEYTLNTNNLKANKSY